MVGRMGKFSRPAIAITHMTHTWQIIGRFLSITHIKVSYYGGLLYAIALRKICTNTSIFRSTEPHSHIRWKWRPSVTTTTVSRRREKSAFHSPDCLPCFLQQCWWLTVTTLALNVYWMKYRVGWGFYYTSAFGITRDILMRVGTPVRARELRH